MIERMKIRAAVEDILASAVANRVFPGSVVGWYRDGKLEFVAAGAQTYAPEAHRVSENSVYDVASITKSIPTSCLMHSLLERGKIGLDDAVINWIPELEMPGADAILVRHLLTYTVALSAPDGMSALARHHPQDLWEHLWKLELAAPPGERYMYTNGPAIMMGLIVERAFGAPLDVVARRELFTPLEMNSTTFHPEPSDAEIVPTEVQDGVEIVGVVHDESSRALMTQGHMSGAAGIFSTAPDLMKFLKLLVEGGSLPVGTELFQPETIHSMHTSQLRLEHEDVGLGWELNRRVTTGHRASAQTFSKTGFTGTLVAVDPELGAAMVHLSNYTYPVRPQSRSAINAVRRALCDAIFEN